MTRSLGAALRHCGIILLVLSAILGMGLSKAQAKDKSGSEDAVTILVYNYVQAPAKRLIEAERQATAILGRAGVHPFWLDCPLPLPEDGRVCRRGFTAVTFRLAVLSAVKRSPLVDPLFGVALPPDFAGVYYDSLPPLPAGDQSQFDADLVLGCVMTHEIGHLLLGKREHSIAGIMRQRWGPEDIRMALRGELVFLPEEAKLIRSAMRVYREPRGVKIAASRPK